MRALMEIAVLIGSSSVLSLVAKSSVVFGAALIAGTALRRRPAAIRHLPFAAAFLALPVVVAVSSLYPLRIELPVEPVLGSSFAAADLDQSSTAVMIVWLSVASALLFPVLAGALQSRCLRRDGMAWPQGESYVRLLAAQMGVTRPVDVLLHGEARGPMTCGVRRPMLILPFDTVGWCAEDLRRALRHELEHVRRGDWLMQCFARAACALCWFNPLAWMAWKQLCMTAEHACDDEVIRDGDVCGYAGQLVALADRLAAATLVNVMGMAGSGDLATRVRAVLDSTRHRGRAGRLPVTLAAVSAIVLIAAVAPLRAIRPTPAALPDVQQVLTFAPLENGIELQGLHAWQVGPPAGGRSRRSEARRQPRQPDARPPEPPFRLIADGGRSRLVVAPSPRLREAVQRAMAQPADGEPPHMRVLAIVRAYTVRQAPDRIPRLPPRQGGQ